MPEGPSIVILKEEVQPFIGKKVIAVSGNTSIDKERMLNRKIVDFKSWGKHFLICFDGFTLKVHFMLWGSYRLNEEKEGRAVRLKLKFKKGEINLYACSVKILEEDPDDIYDWTGDVMNDTWSPRKARNKLKDLGDEIAADALLMQDVFAGVGNIIKNEVLWRIKVHPTSLVGKIPSRKLSAMIKDARDYSFIFYDLKKKYILRKSWKAHGKGVCPRCDNTINRKHLGRFNRRAFFCDNCQVVYK